MPEVNRFGTGRAPGVGRSTALFLGFLTAVQALAAMVLFLPLVVIDPTHAPFLAWSGYFLRYVPLVMAGSIAWFGWQMIWHIETVKRAVGFRFVDTADEPRICRIIEPLILTLGLPAPFVGVVESDARNAFACGIARNNAVVVVTRGLIDDLSDDEQACVLGHELSHIRNGDTRLMAVANIRADALSWLHKNNPLKFTPVHVVLAIAVPVVLPLTLVGNLIAHLAVRAGQVSRLMIASAREFIADAQAVELTRNPAAKVSALAKVEQHWQVGGLRQGDDAMMIAGETQGKNATHPTVAQRIAALARVTGSMVFNAPGALPQSAWDSSASLSQAREAAMRRQIPKAAALPRVRAGSEANFLGLSRKGMVYLAATIAGLVTLHWSELGNPHAMQAKFDVRPLALILGHPIACHFDDSASCEERFQGNMFRDYTGQANTLAGWLARSSTRRAALGLAQSDLAANRGFELTHGISGRMAPLNIPVRPGRQWDEDVRARVRIAEANQVGCFSEVVVDDNPDGRYRIGETDSSGSTFQDAVNTAHASAEAAAITRSGAGSDDLIKSYVANRQLLLAAFAYNLYGLAGLRSLQSEYLTGPHRAMVGRIAERLKDPAFTARLSAIELAEYRALTRSPESFLPCQALRHLPAGKGLL